ncbi:hypothetical protein KNP414_07531 [Paenibacillus mucilaginosus KNP414]|uniref:Uncharacterized protein n=1 Tax=Paenibacillus mucilaginosus (strain KNP414) TaxID=1036673 RepID=F8FA52_PAEMK|nr:hypothetical protein KNP414_07531 [Paenibacillus mucilaginosus KNP414]
MLTFNYDITFEKSSQQYSQKIYLFARMEMKTSLMHQSSRAIS